MEKDEIKIWGKNLKFASKTTMEFSVTGIHDPFFWFSGSAQAALCCCTVAVRHLPQQQEVAASGASGASEQTNWLKVATSSRSGYFGMPCGAKKNLGRVEKSKKTRFFQYFY